MSRISETSQEKEFLKLKSNLCIGYRPYRDRSKTTALYRNLSDKMEDIMSNLRCYARTVEQTKIIANKLYELTDYALRVSVYEALSLQEQTQNEEIEIEPQFALQLE